MIWVEEEENSDQSNKRQNSREILHTESIDTTGLGMWLEVGK